MDAVTISPFRYNKGLAGTAETQQPGEIVRSYGQPHDYLCLGRLDAGLPPTLLIACVSASRKPPAFRGFAEISPGFVLA